MKINFDLKKRRIYYQKAAFFRLISTKKKKKKPEVLKLKGQNTDLYSWMAGSAGKLMQGGRRIGSVKKPS